MKIKKKSEILEDSEANIILDCLIIEEEKGTLILFLTFDLFFSSEFLKTGNWYN
jgi:hypothetical protein